MSKRKTKTTDDDSPNSTTGNDKKKKLVQSRLDIHFSFGRSSKKDDTDRRKEVEILSKPNSTMEASSTEKKERRENAATAALIRATKISSTGMETVTIDLDQEPSTSTKPKNQNDEEIEIADFPEDCGSTTTTSGKSPSKTTRLKQSFWEEDEDDVEGEDAEEQVKKVVQDSDEGSEDDDEMKPTFLGVPLEALRKANVPLRKLSPSKDGRHTILFDTSSSMEDTVSNGTPPRPYPKRFVDKWDNDHVRMPCSFQSEYPVSETVLDKRWELVQTALTRQWTSVDDIRSAILSYNERYAAKWSFAGLEKYVELLDEPESELFFSDTIPKIAKLAMKLPDLVTQPIPLLKRGMRHSITMTQQQAASILANAFFCTWPRRNQRRSGSEFADYPEINFNRLFGTGKILRMKLDFIFHYFRRVIEKMPEGVLTFERASMERFPDWATSQCKLSKLHISRKGTIEDFGEGMLQVDFANKFLGGGVLSYGAVQEEIRFLICPELIVPMLFAESLAENECFIMIGSERYSFYTGYADSLQWLQKYSDTTPRDEWGRRRVKLVAIDALPFNRSNEQFRKQQIDRELNKAYSGFAQPGVSVEYLSPVATGNWGCGAFGGDKDLKSLIQLMSASEAGRDVVYFTFDDTRLMERIHGIYEHLVNKDFTIGSIYALLIQYCEYVNQNFTFKTASRTSSMSLFEFIMKNDQ